MPNARLSTISKFLARLNKVRIVRRHSSDDNSHILRLLSHVPVALGEHGLFAWRCEVARSRFINVIEWEHSEFLHDEIAVLCQPAVQVRPVSTALTRSEYLFERVPQALLKGTVSSCLQCWDETSWLEPNLSSFPRFLAPAVSLHYWVHCV